MLWADSLHSCFIQAGQSESHSSSSIPCRSDDEELPRERRQELSSALMTGLHLILYPAGSSKYFGDNMLHAWTFSQVCSASPALLRNPHLAIHKTEWEDFLGIRVIVLVRRLGNRRHPCLVSGDPQWSSYCLTFISSCSVKGFSGNS